MNESDKAATKGILIFLAIGFIARYAPSIAFWAVMIVVFVLGLPTLVAAVVGPIRRRRRSKKSGQNDKPWSASGL